VRLLKSNTRSVSFELTRIERGALVRMLKRYPVVPAGHHRLSRTDIRPEDQQLLEEAQEEFRRTHRRKIQNLLRSKTRLKEHESGFIFSLKHDQVDWFLQVLNDIRIGSWVALGSPDGPEQILAALTIDNVHHYQVMETAGIFQMLLLSALKAG